MQGNRGLQAFTLFFLMLLPCFSFLILLVFQALKQQQQRNQRRQGGMPTTSSPRLLLKTIKDMADNITTKTGRWQLLYCHNKMRDRGLISFSFYISLVLINCMVMYTVLKIKPVFSHCPHQLSGGFRRRQQNVFIIQT